MSDLDDETDTSCGEEQIVSDWEVRKEWLESILSKYHKGKAVKVLEFKVNSGCTTSESVLSAITSVTVKYLAALTSITNKPIDKCRADLIIKQLPKDPFSRFFVTEGQFDLREIKFYTQVMPDLKEFKERQLAIDKCESNIILPVPTCFHAHYSPAGGTDDSPVPPESMLVLSDLSDNYDSVKFSEGLTLDQAMAALDAIARIHAHSLSMKVVDGQSLSERYPFLFQTAKATDSYQQLVERGLPQLAHFLESRPGLETVLETLLVLRPRTKDIISALLAPEGPLALITHTDFWSNNLLFRKGRPTECFILDWQMVTYSRPTNDIALLLVSSVPTELRRKHTKTLLDKYWDKLNWTCLHLGLNIVKDLGYTRKDLDKDYRKSQLLALLLCIGSVDVALGDPLTEQRLIDVLEDLYNDGVLTDEAIITTNEADS
ncbi:PREDICTED: uncharacterized protein LOC108780816 [Cyphomyrmex costatus]|uniref:Putative oxidoreductase dhs-27 n=1 Tax=Cyphomyrmex costatus TaxID=456900 RepID=A0A151I946_9HYME|nr:PREDICTED: uncharacterized protein LOC108780816 [Cyphomyrmex costatus]KYM95016.1 putative oxidoreductase dhs-27 [Cyphomyrmex costatus]